VDVRGRLVLALETGPSPAGAGAIHWDLKDADGAAVPTGVYFCRVVVNGRPTGGRKILVMR
jgi:hypothetical protein